MTSFFPSSVLVSRLVIGSTSKSWKVSTVFIGRFADGSTLGTRNSGKYQLIQKDLVKSSEVAGTRKNGYPEFIDQYCDKDSNCLYAQDWSKRKTWRV